MQIYIVAEKKLVIEEYDCCIKLNCKNQKAAEDLLASIKKNATEADVVWQRLIKGKKGKAALI